METKIFDHIFSSPIFLASGTLVQHFEDIDKFINAGVGAVIPRSTRKEMIRKLQPSPCLYQSGGYGNEFMVNAEWTGLDIDYWQPYLEKLSNTGKVIMSVSGRDIKGCVDVCRIIDEYDFPLIEINVSCAHSNSIFGFINRNGDHISKLVKSIKDAGVGIPISIKLGHSDFIVELASKAKESGADAITAINSFGPVFDFSIDNLGGPRPVVGIENAKGGLSGAPLFNIALTDVAEIKRQLKIPVLGCGGVRSAEDVVKMLMAGASAVEIYTAAHIRGHDAPSFFKNLNDELASYLKSKSIKDVSSIVGKALPLLDQKTNLTKLVPTICLKDCTGCNKCVRICLPGAIKEANKAENRFTAKIDGKVCNGCGNCVSVCPFNAIKL